MLIYAMSVSVDGYVADRDGGIGWAPPPTADVFALHLERVGSLGGYLLGRRLYEIMRPWETDPAMRANDAMTEFAEIWTALPKVVFSRTLDRVEGNARLATGSVADEIARTLGSADGDVEIGGPALAAQAITLGLVDEFRVFRQPVVLGGGLPYLPALDEPARLDLVETRIFQSPVVYERYRRAG